MTDFKIGDLVRWESQGHGSIKIKRGQVVAVLTAESFQKTHTVWRFAKKKFPNHRQLFDGWSLPYNQKVAYLVEVRDGKTERAVPKLYLPDPRKLKKDHYRRKI